MAEATEAGLPAVETSRQRAARRVERLAWLLDESVRLPGGYRVGIDGFVGMIPGAGDAAGLAASTYILLQGRSLGATPAVMLRMFGNVVLELLVGIIPLFGDLFDFAFKANRRNVALLERYIDDAEQTHRASMITLIVVLLLMLAITLTSLYGAWLLMKWIVGLF
jgi:hypothetical protein